MRRRPIAFALVSAPIDMPPFLDSLAENQLCGLDLMGRGTYTAKGITKLCEALKGSAVTSLRCATAHRVFAFLSTPIDTAHHPPPTPPPTFSTTTCSVPAEEPRLHRASMAT